MTPLDLGVHAFELGVVLRLPRDALGDAAASFCHQPTPARLAPHAPRPTMIQGFGITCAARGSAGTPEDEADHEERDRGPDGPFRLDLHQLGLRPASSTYFAACFAFAFASSRFISPPVVDFMA
jgi:hypothetical protein